MDLEHGLGLKQIDIQTCDHKLKAVGSQIQIQIVACQTRAKLEINYYF